MGSWDEAPRVVPEVLDAKNSVKFAIFTKQILPGGGFSMYNN